MPVSGNGWAATPGALGKRWSAAPIISVRAAGQLRPSLKVSGEELSPWSEWVHQHEEQLLENHPFIREKQQKDRDQGLKPSLGKSTGTEVPATHLCPFFPGQAREPLFTGGARGPRVAPVPTREWRCPRLPGHLAWCMVPAMSFALSLSTSSTR